MREQAPPLSHPRAAASRSPPPLAAAAAEQHPAAMAAAAQPAAVASTSQFFLDFFPTAYSRLSQQYPALWAQLQPAWLAQRCPEQTLQLGSLGIRNAELLPWQLAGVAVATTAAALLRGHRFAYLRHSLLFFALMNLRQAGSEHALPAGVLILVSCDVVNL